MATIAIREYADIVPTWGGKVVQAPAEPPIADQSVTSSASHAESAAFNANTSFIGISTVAATGLSYQIGAAPVATTSHLRIPPNTIIYVGVVRGAGQKISVIDN